MLIDSCPDEAGKPSAGGCPDEDEDGIADKFDDCPQEPGPAATKGCPDKDKDGDGIVDEKDHCPEEPDQEKLDGCPDSDGDGVADMTFVMVKWEPNTHPVAQIPTRMESLTNLTIVQTWQTS
ncbi:MAG: thrombospondin type 3 repeat-containing protein [Saprospiraceae bacterium]